MKVLFNRKAMLAAIGQASKAVSARSPKPVLKNLLMVADVEDGSTLAGTDLEIGLRLRLIGVKVDEPGRCLFDPLRMSAFLNAVPDDEVALEADATSITVMSSRAKSRFPAEDVASYPDWSDAPPPDHLVANGAALRAAITRTVFACDVNSTRYAMGGILFSFAAEACNLVATDGRRLAEQSLDVEFVGDPYPGSSGDAMPVVPQRAAMVLAGLIEDDEPSVIFSFDKSSAHFHTSAGVMYCRLVEGRFPRYQEVFPASKATSVVPIESDAFRSTLAVAAIGTSETTKAIVLDFGGDGLVASGSAAERGASRAEMPLLCVMHSAVRIGIDPTYIFPVLKALGDIPVRVEVWNSLTPIVLRTDDGYAYVAMPTTLEAAPAA